MMANVDATWLVGSVLFGAAQDIDINGTGYQFAAGVWYLRSASPSESLVDEMLAHMIVEGLAGASVTITKRRTVLISATPIFAVTWTDPAVRDLFGFTGNLSGATSYEAPYPSPLLWSAGFPATRAVPDGTPGRPVEDVRTQFSRDGTRVVSIFHHTQVWDELAWTNVMRARVWYDRNLVAQARGGTWEQFRESVFLLNRRFQVYEIVEENSASAAPVVWPSSLGNYRAKTVPIGAPTRTIANANTRWNPVVETIRG